MKKLILFAILIFSNGIIFSQIPTYVPTTGLTGYWPFTNNANDMSANANHGNVNGATLTIDRFGSPNSAYSFNGTSDFISTPYAGILGSNARAVSFWAKTTYSASSTIAVGWGSNSTGQRFNCGFNYVSNGATIGVANGALTFATPYQVSDNQWHHYVFQLNSSFLNQIEIYQDGTLLTTINHSFNPNQPVNTVQGFNVHFGKIVYAPAPDFFNGQLDDIGMWDRALTTTEIATLFNSTTTGINETIDQSNYNIFPNPCNDGFVTISGIDKPSILEMYNSLGMLVNKTSTTSDHTRIDLSELSNGVYFIYVKNSDDIFIYKIIRK